MKTLEGSAFEVSLCAVVEADQVDECYLSGGWSSEHSDGEVSFMHLEDLYSGAVAEPVLEGHVHRDHHYRPNLA